MGDQVCVRGRQAQVRNPPGADRVNDALVDRPELLPLLQRHVLGRTLAQDELLQRLQLEAPPEHALHAAIASCTQLPLLMR